MTIIKKKEDMFVENVNEGNSILIEDEIIRNHV